MKILTKAAIGLSAAGAAYLLIQKSRSGISVEAPPRVEIHGFVSSGYEAVREAFAENFSRRRELGAACCVYHKGESIPDSRLAPLVDPTFSEMLFGFPIRLSLEWLNHHSNIYRALRGSEMPHDDQRIYSRNLEVPAGGGVGTARV